MDEGGGAVDLSRVVWRKSTRSDANGQCVEIARVSQIVGIRDSKNKTGPVLSFSTAAFEAFLDGVRNGEFGALGY
jgi:hypothetical protein